MPLFSRDYREFRNWFVASCAALQQWWPLRGSEMGGAGDGPGWNQLSRQCVNACHSAPHIVTKCGQSWQWDLIARTMSSACLIITCHCLAACARIFLLFPVSIIKRGIREENGKIFTGDFSSISFFLLRSLCYWHDETINSTQGILEEFREIFPRLACFVSGSWWFFFFLFFFKMNVGRVFFYLKLIIANNLKKFWFLSEKSSDCIVL